jgi:formate hydrogenlyase subunit 3/multisubunit Na+/H+ antiporter MnhD subunit
MMPPFQELGKLLVVLGIVAVAVGLVMMFGDRIGLDKLGLGRLPGDIAYEGKRFKFYFPIVTCIVISVVVSIILWLFRR